MRMHILAGLVSAIVVASPVLAASPAEGLTTHPSGIKAVEFLDMIFNQKKVAEAFETYVGDEYIQHNPQVPSGVEAAVTGLGAFVENAPEKPYDFKRVIAEDGLVAVHSHVRFAPEGQGFAVVDIFRVDQNGKIAEHWDVVQQVPATSANENTMF